MKHEDTVGETTCYFGESGLLFSFCGFYFFFIDTEKPHHVTASGLGFTALCVLLPFPTLVLMSIDRDSEQ